MRFCDHGGTEVTLIDGVDQYGSVETCRENILIGYAGFVS